MTQPPYIDIVKPQNDAETIAAAIARWPDMAPYFDTAQVTTWQDEQGHVRPCVVVTVYERDSRKI